MEPTANDVAAVSQMLEGQPAPQPAPQAPVASPAPQAPAPVATPAPAQQQPAQPTPQPAPTSQPQDPFSALFEQPAPQPAPQAPAPQSSQPTEPATTPQPQQPAEPSQPTQPVSTEPQYQSFDDYMAEVTKGIGSDDITTPDPSNIDPNDEAGIKTFFDDLVNTAVQKASQEVSRSQAIQTTERRLWDEAMNKYGSLRENKNLRDMVHSIRMGEFQKGVAITPTQAADRLLDALQAQYRQGVADNAVVTTIESVQPNGGSGTAVETTTDADGLYSDLQHGGENALANYLDGQIKAGKL